MGYPKLYSLSLGFCGLLAALALLLDTPAALLAGLERILFTADTLITDYIALGGLGAALMNCALVTLVSTGVLYFSKAPAKGSAAAALGLIAGFSLFGKDLLNICPILAGAFLYSRFRRESFGKYAATALMSTCLAPIVSALWFSGTGWAGVVGGTLTGLLIGFLIPILSTYTFRIQKGMNFYNVGFACGLLALMIVPVLASLELAPETVLLWAQGYDLPLGLLLGGLCLFCLLAGLGSAGGPRAALRDYRRLLTASGRAPCELLDHYGPAAVLLNTGVNGLIATGYILLIGGDLNGTTLAGIFTIIGFSAWGKHAGNMLPVMLGAVLGGLTMPGFSLTDPAIQFGVLFCTTLSPISGCYGWPFGILAGFLHISVVRRTGGPVAGLNLYNNGFSGGLVATVLYGILTPLGLLRHPEERDR